jgi:hypothetical protein
MSRGGKRGKDIAGLDQLVEDITVDVYGDDEQLWAFRQVFEDEVPLPANGFVIGEPVSVVKIDYDGNERRGLTAQCRREDGSKYLVAAADVVFPEGSSGARYVAAYRKWLGIESSPAGEPPHSGRKSQRKIVPKDLDPRGPLDLVVLSVKDRVARCHPLGSEGIITYRPNRLWSMVPGEIATVKPRKQWSYAGHSYLSGEIVSTRVDAAALGLVPLRLQDMGIWDPKQHYWGEEGEPIEEWAKPIIAWGPRPEFEMEQVLPGADPEDPFSDPITEATDLMDAGDGAGAKKILMGLSEADLRCLDAQAHLGNLVFDNMPEFAIRHYAAGLRIGELSLKDDFDGLLPWGHIDNRPFLRCMHGYGLCLWRLGRLEEAGGVFDRMLWLNPSDNQGARFLIQPIKAGMTWEQGRGA